MLTFLPSRLRLVLLPILLIGGLFSLSPEASAANFDEFVLKRYDATQGRSLEVAPGSELLPGAAYELWINVSDTVTAGSTADLSLSLQNTYIGANAIRNRDTSFNVDYTADNGGRANFDGEGGDEIAFSETSGGRLFMYQIGLKPFYGVAQGEPIQVGPVQAQVTLPDGTVEDYTFPAREYVMGNGGINITRVSHMNPAMVGGEKCYYGDRAINSAKYKPNCIDRTSLTALQNNRSLSNADYSAGLKDTETPLWASQCGNGLTRFRLINPSSIVPLIEKACDDGNTDSGDGCSSTCQVESNPPLLLGQEFYLTRRLPDDASYPEVDYYIYFHDSVEYGPTGTPQPGTSLYQNIRIRIPFVHEGVQYYLPPAHLTLVDDELAFTKSDGFGKLNYRLRLADPSFVNQWIPMKVYMVADGPSGEVSWTLSGEHKVTDQLKPDDGAPQHMVRNLKITPGVEEPTIPPVEETPVEESSAEPVGDLFYWLAEPEYEKPGCGNGVRERLTDAPGTMSCDDGNIHPGDGCSEICEVEAGKVSLNQKVSKTIQDSPGAALDFTYYLSVLNNTGQSIEAKNIALEAPIDARVQFDPATGTNFFYGNTLHALGGMTQVSGNTIRISSVDPDLNPDVTIAPGENIRVLFSLKLDRAHIGADLDLGASKMIISQGPGAGTYELEAMQYRMTDDVNPYVQLGIPPEPVRRHWVLDNTVAPEVQPDTGTGCSTGQHCSNDVIHYVVLDEDTCGDGLLGPNDQCDDGNLKSNDGCDSHCKLEHPELCGNNTDDAGETCDDGNQMSGDGCDNLCAIEAYCGDGVVQAAADHPYIDTDEACDDGNLANGDGCDDQCLWEDHGFIAVLSSSPASGTSNPEGTEFEVRLLLSNSQDVAVSNIVIDDILPQGLEYVRMIRDNGDSVIEDTANNQITIQASDLGPRETQQYIFVVKDDENTFYTPHIHSVSIQADQGGIGISRTSNPNRYNIVPGGGEGVVGGVMIGVGTPTKVAFTKGNDRIEGFEECDDGNTDPNDGCSADGRLEQKNLCGNGTTDPGEGDDDGNTRSGDGTSRNCEVEAYCGDGATENGEQCDDGNFVDDDACSNACISRQGTCGNGGDPEYGEACDDGNTISNDGCSGTEDPDPTTHCQIEVSECGNGIPEWDEVCDDGNEEDGNGFCKGDCSDYEADVNLVDFVLQADPASGTTVGARNTIVLTTILDNRVNMTFSGKVTMPLPEGLAYVDTLNDNGATVTNATANGRDTVTIDISELKADGDASDGDQTFVSILTRVASDKESGVLVNEATLKLTTATGAEFNQVSNKTLHPVVKAPVNQCGNDRLEPGEVCEDGNTDDNDGCSSQCLPETGLAPECHDGPNAHPDCTLSTCGNGTVDPGEDDDQGNAISGDGDGLNRFCQKEGSCGDGVEQDGEQCDDGNLVDGDGCDHMCRDETGTNNGTPLPSPLPIGRCTGLSAPACETVRPEARPGLHDPVFADYRACVLAGIKTQEVCTNEWATARGFTTCTAANAATACSGVTGGGDDPLVSCSIGSGNPEDGDVKTVARVDKNIKRDKGAQPEEDGTHYVRKGDSVEYVLRVKFDDVEVGPDVILGDTIVRVYDFTIPAESGQIFGRAGISGEDDSLFCQNGAIQACWTMQPAESEGVVFVRQLTPTELQALKGTTEGLPLRYKMDSALAITADTEKLSNVAVVTVTYEYFVKGDNGIERKTETDFVSTAGTSGTFDPACDKGLNDFINAGGSDGGIAETILRREFIQASGGNIAIIDDDERISADAQNFGGSDRNTAGEIQLSSGSLDQFGNAQTDDNRIDELQNFNDFDDKDAYYEYLMRNRPEYKTHLPFEQNIANNPDASIIVLRNGGDITIGGEYDLGSEAKTFIFENTNVTITEDVIFTEAIGAIIIRGGTLTIEDDVLEIEGLYIVEALGGQGGQILANDDSDEQLNIYGLIMGDTGDLIRKRHYIGAYDTNGDFQAGSNILVNADNRIYEYIPGIEGILGNDWGQE